MTPTGIPLQTPATIKNKDVSSTSLSLFSATSGLYYVFPRFAEKILPMCLLRNWEDKPFPYPTFMFVGNGVGFRPSRDVRFAVYSRDVSPPQTVVMYCDGTYYATLTPVHGMIISLCYYCFTFTEKGFHHLTFIPEGNESDILEIDFQVGMHGFREHILPYLLMP